MPTKTRPTVKVSIPVMHPSMQLLINASAARGWISYEELNAALPDEYLTANKMDDLLALISNLGIDLIGEDFRMRRGWDQFFVPLQTSLRFKRDTPWKDKAQELAELAEEQGKDPKDSVHIDADDDSNDMDIIQDGNDNDAEIYMQGDDNVYKITQTGDDKEGEIRAFGDDSEFTITQSGTGEHYAKIYANTSADNNDADIAQTGSGDHYMRLNVYTDDYTVDATQSGSTPKSITATYKCSTNCNKTVTINQSD